MVRKQNKSKTGDKGKDWMPVEASAACLGWGNLFSSLSQKEGAEGFNYTEGLYKGAALGRHLSE